MVCCGVPIANLNIHDAYSKILKGISDKRAFPVRHVNAYSLACAESIPTYRAILNSNGVNFCDSQNISVLYRFVFPSLTKIIKIRGHDLLIYSLNQKSNHRNIFIGSTPSTLEKMKKRIEEQFPLKSNSVYYSPPYDENIELLVKNIKDNLVFKENDLIWIAMGTPKQDIVGSYLARELEKVVISIGAAFNFFAGDLPECPKLLRIMGMEWLFRLLTEPQRLWRRYLFGNSKFLLMILSHYKRDRKMNIQKKKLIGS